MIWFHSRTSYDEAIANHLFWFDSRTSYEKAVTKRRKKMTTKTLRPPPRPEMASKSTLPVTAWTTRNLDRRPQSEATTDHFLYCQAQGMWSAADFSADWNNGLAVLRGLGGAISPLFWNQLTIHKSLVKRISSGLIIGKTISCFISFTILIFGQAVMNRLQKKRRTRDKTYKTR